MLNEIDGISCTPADGALYLFPKIDIERFDITDDEQFVLDLLRARRFSSATAEPSTGRIPTTSAWCSCPDTQTLTSALERLGNFMGRLQAEALARGISRWLCSLPYWRINGLPAVQDELRETILWVQM